MINLSDVIKLWMATNKNLSRSWELYEEVDGCFVIKPKFGKYYKINARASVLSDSINLHYDDDGYPDDKGCHTETIEAYDVNFFKKLARWMYFVRRR